MRPSVDARKWHIANCIGLLASARGFLAIMIFYMSVVLADDFGIRRSADPASDQVETQKWPSHLPHRRESDFSAHLFRQCVTKMKEEARYEYLKGIGLDLARPWPKGLKIEFGLGNAKFGISGVKFFPFPGVHNNAVAQTLYLVTRRGISKRSAPTTHPDPTPISPS